MVVCFCFLKIRRPPRSTRTDTLFPYTTLFRSDDIGRAFGMRRDRRVGVLRLQLQQLGFAERLVDDAHARPQQHVAPELAVHIAAEMPVGDRKSTRLNSSH